MRSLEGKGFIGRWQPYLSVDLGARTPDQPALARTDQGETYREIDDGLRLDLLQHKKVVPASEVRQTFDDLKMLERFPTRLGCHQSVQVSGVAHAVIE